MHCAEEGAPTGSAHGHSNILSQPPPPRPRILLPVLLTHFINCPEAPGLVLGGTHPPHPSLVFPGRMPCRGRGLQLPLLSTSLGGLTCCPVAQCSLDPPGGPQLPTLQQRLRHHVLTHTHPLHPSHSHLSTPHTHPCSCLCVANLTAGNECPGASSL